MDASLRPAEIERLLAHSGWLTTLALRLVRDPAAADDLVQDTWHAALRARGGVRDERGWLATLLANRARARARAEEARRARERHSARAEAVDGPDVLAERAECQRRLLAHVLALDEPYRGTLLARFVDGHTPAEIARARGVNESTVRTWLARALERLRARLAGDDPDRHALGLGALLGPRAPRASLPGRATPGAGVLLLATWKSLALAGLALLAAWLAWSRLPLRSTPDAGLDVASVEHPSGGRRLAAVLPDRREEAPSGAPSPPIQPSAEPSAAPRAQSLLEVRFSRDDAPLAGVRAWLVPEARAGWPVRVRRAVLAVDVLDLGFERPADAPGATSDGHGVATFVELPPAHWFVLFQLPGAADTPRVSSSLRGDVPHTIRLGRACIRGQVLDEHGRARVGVGVRIAPREPDPRTWTHVSVLTRTDARGEYSADGLWATDEVLRSGQPLATGYDVVVEADGRFDGRGESQRRVVELRRGEERQVDFGGGGSRWSGRLRNTLDEPFPGTPWLELSSAADALVTPIATDGAFQLVCAPGPWRVRAFAAGCPAAGFDLGELEVPPGDQVRDLVVPGTRLTGTLRPARADQALPAECGIRVRPKGHDYPAAFRRATLAADGRYWIDGLTPGEWHVGVWPGALLEAPAVTVLEGMGVLAQDLTWVPR